MTSLAHVEHGMRETTHHLCFTACPLRTTLRRARVSPGSSAIPRSASTSEAIAEFGGMHGEGDRVRR